MHKVNKGLLILATIAICLAVCGCDEVTPTPAATPTPAPTADISSLEQALADYQVYDEPATAGDIAASRAALDFAADALEMGDKDLFLDMLTGDLREDFASADFSSAGTAGMAAALRRATLAQSIRDYSIIYDTTDQGMNFQIFLVKEDGAWKINSM